MSQTVSSEEKDREPETSAAVAVAEISNNEGPTNDQTDLMNFFQNLAQEMSPPPPQPPAPPKPLSQKQQQQKQQRSGHRPRGRQGTAKSYISTDDHFDSIGGSISSVPKAVEPTDNINDEPMMMIQDQQPDPQKTHSSITPETPVHRTLANIEEQMVTIRNKLDKRSPKVTTAQLNQKLDRIINILRKNGISE